MLCCNVYNFNFMILILVIPNFNHFILYRLLLCGCLEETTNERVCLFIKEWHGGMHHVLHHCTLLKPITKRSYDRISKQSKKEDFEDSLLFLTPIFSVILYIFLLRI